MNSDQSNITVVNHVVVQHFLTLLRPEESRHNQYRLALNHIYTFLAYEAFRIMTPPVEPVELEVQGIPLTKQPLIISDDIVFVALMRGGMAPAAHLGGIFARASVAHVDVRPSKKGKPKISYERMPLDCTNKKFAIIAPRIESGGSCGTVINRIKKLCGADVPSEIIIINVVCSPQGTEALLQSHPDVPIVTASIEHGLNDAGQVVPGIGWTGQRVYQTVELGEH